MSSAQGDSGTLPHHRNEAVPWWTFALFGGLATLWLLAPTPRASLGVPVGEGWGAGGLTASLVAGGVYLVVFFSGAVAEGSARAVSDAAGELGTAAFLAQRLRAVKTAIGAI